MRHYDVTLDDKYLLLEGRAYITGVQALIRVLLDRARLDKIEGLNTAGFVSGYRGSPLGGLDQQAHRADALLTEHNVVFKEGLNEDLAATASTPPFGQVPAKLAWRNASPVRSTPGALPYHMPKTPS